MEKGGKKIPYVGMVGRLRLNFGGFTYPYALRMNSDAKTLMLQVDADQGLVRAADSILEVGVEANGKGLIVTFDVSQRGACRFTDCSEPHMIQKRLSLFGVYASGFGEKSRPGSFEWSIENELLGVRRCKGAPHRSRLMVTTRA